MKDRARCSMASDECQQLNPTCGHLGVIMRQVVYCGRHNCEYCKAIHRERVRRFIQWLLRRFREATVRWHSNG